MPQYPSQQPKNPRSEEENSRTLGAAAGGAILGASLGGPAGALIGGIIGLWLGETVNGEKRKQGRK